LPDADRDLPSAAADLELLRGAGEEAGRIALRYFRKDPEVWLKGGQSPVSEADYAVDRFLRETLLAARPSYGWLSDETADSPARLAARRTFVVDPIDGTRAFLDGRDVWCVSLAVVEAGRPLAGVLDCPVRREVYAAVTGSGVFLNGDRIAVRKPGPQIELVGAKVLVDGFPEALRRRVHRVPHVPSLAYRIAMVASGALDATFVKPNAQDWDLAAADLLLAEAGGTLVDGMGRAPAYAGRVTTHGFLAAGSGALLDAMRDVIAVA